MGKKTLTDAGLRGYDQLGLDFSLVTTVTPEDLKEAIKHFDYTKVEWVFWAHRRPGTKL